MKEKPASYVLSHATKALKEQFTTIYNAESDAIFRFCIVKVSEREIAIDIVQETFVRLWQTFSKGKKIENTRAFLFKVANNLIIDWYRKKKAIPFHEIQDNESEDPFDPPDDKSSDGTFIGAEGRHLLSKIYEISPSNHSAVYLRFVEDISPGDIAEILGISMNAASVRINRGIEELKKLTGYDIEKYDQDHE